MAGRSAPAARWASLLHPDFAAVLTRPACTQSHHFALHHLDKAPQRKHCGAVDATPGTPAVEISTSVAPRQGSSVDILSAPAKGTRAPALWLGLVVPKRHARRAVTRSLLKRQMRSQADRWGSRMSAGQWVVRLRAPFDIRIYPSAASVALQTAARAELDALFGRAFGP